MTLHNILLGAADAASPHLEIPQQWGQGRATFGGLLAACLFEKLKPQVAADRPVRSLLVSFVAPVAPGPMEVRVKVLRAGKAATQVQATAYQNDQACVVMLASFGGDRASAVRLDAAPAPTIKAPRPRPSFPSSPA
ncbi:thioesterase family protein [Pseudomonas sp. LPB0260]|uniref:thioesterase family protein n=1 Tax=Pseudomonas sp. LPB0260 TaxID=2614442 RepID=UPI002113DB04|nr:thioesterase family protein [Pseudomonas sp. LPB0260]